jgi:DNA polymerase-3 subunit delta
MPIYFYWGEDEFRLNQAVDALRDRTLDPQWASFNYDKIGPEVADGPIQALNQAMTPPFGMGKRLVWLVDTTLAQRCAEPLLQELERTLPNVPETTVLLLTSSGKPDGRLKSTKLLKRHAEIQEFAAIPPWKTEALVQQVRQMAKSAGVNLTPEAMELLADAVGNDTRLLWSELNKLKVFAGNRKSPLTPPEVSTLVMVSTQNSLQLAAAIRDGKTPAALGLVADLLNRNEQPLRIVATLVRQFRTWLWVKLMLEMGERDDRAIAKAADVQNPKRIYFLKGEVRVVSLSQLQQTLPLLMELEFGLKRGEEPLAALQTKVIELCQICQPQSLGTRSQR